MEALFLEHEGYFGALGEKPPGSCFPKEKRLRPILKGRRRHVGLCRPTGAFLKSSYAEEAASVSTAASPSGPHGHAVLRKQHTDAAGTATGEVSRRDVLRREKSYGGPTGGFRTDSRCKLAEA